MYMGVLSWTVFKESGLYKSTMDILRPQLTALVIERLSGQDLLKKTKVIQEGATEGRPGSSSVCLTLLLLFVASVELNS